MKGIVTIYATQWLEKYYPADRLNNDKVRQAILDFADLIDIMLEKAEEQEKENDKKD